jgi:hypothetical protein
MASSDTDPTPGIQRRGTGFASLVQKVTLVAKYGKLMVASFRRRKSRDQHEQNEMVPIPPQQDGKVPDFTWDELRALLQKSGNKYVLVNFYSHLVSSACRLSDK